MTLFRGLRKKDWNKYVSVKRHFLNYDASMGEMLSSLRSTVVGSLCTMEKQMVSVSDHEVLQLADSAYEPLKVYWDDRLAGNGGTDQDNIRSDFEISTAIVSGMNDFALLPEKKVW